MTDPATRHAHSVEQILDLVPEIPTAIRERVAHLLVDRDRSIETGIDSTLRKEVSAYAAGNGVNIITNLPTYTILGDAVGVDVEKHHDLSRFEISASMSGTMTSGIGRIALGAHIAAEDDPGFVPVDVFLGDGKVSNVATITTFGNTDGFSLPQGRYLIFLEAAVSAGDTLNQDGAASIRVVESLY